MSKNGDKKEKEEKSFSESMELFDTVFTQAKVTPEQGTEEGEVPREDNADPEPESFSESMDLFDTIFTRVREKEKKGPEPGTEPPEKGIRPVVRPSGNGGLERDEVSGKKREPRAVPRPGSEAPPRGVPREEKVLEKAAPSVKEKKAVSREKPLKMLDPLRIALFLVVLLVLAGAAMHFSGALDLGALLGPAPPKQAKTVGMIPKVKDRVQVRRDPQKDLSAPGPAVKGEEKKETPALSEFEGMKSPVPITRKDVAPVEPIKGDPGSVPQGRIAPRKSMEVEVPVSPAPAPEAGGKEPKQVPDFSAGAVPHPYSIYLGSYGSLEKVNKAVSGYREVGLSLYWVRLDLGNKGIWYRLFAGYFKTRAEADALIRDKKVVDAVSRSTRYALLTGVFTSQEALRAGMARLTELGYSPYVITEEGVSRLYVGAFFQKARAEKVQEDLSVKGIDNRVVRR